MTVLHMNCVEGMRMFPDNTFDSIVTDPPYELGFMGKSWDSTGIAYSVEMWREALRVLKPGGHLLSFSGSRTYHRMACAIEDGGFDIRDQIMWVYGSGFPKSLDVSKAIDKAAGAEREVLGVRARPDGSTRDATIGGQNGVSLAGSADGALNTNGAMAPITAPATDAARQWDGWGTALKPAHEPICVARKPLIGTVVANVLAYGCGALNIDGCRVGDDVRINPPATLPAGGNSLNMSTVGMPQGAQGREAVGRWPANLIHDGSDEVLAAFPNAPGQQCNVSFTAPSAKTSTVHGAMGREGEPSANSANNGDVGFKMKPGARRLDEGSAARFFYCAKASKKDRGEGNTHPTVKPTDLMRYLVRLVTPPGGIVFDPFAGSGSTFKAATLEGFDFIGFELQAEYVAIANARGRLTA